MDTSVLAIATAVAAEMDGWTATPGAWEHGGDAYLVRDGLRLQVRPAGHPLADRGKLEVSLSLTPEEFRHRPYNGLSARIRVSASKRPALIARDIDRRLLPNAVAQYKDVLERVARARVTSDRRADMVGVMRHLWKVTPYTDYRMRLGRHGESVNCEAHVLSDGDSVHFEIKCNADNAAKLATFLRELRDNG